MIVISRRRRARPGKMPTSSVIKHLADFYDRNGYVRWQNTRRLRNESWGSYKKGDEVRLVAQTRAELRLIRRLLRRAGFRPGRPFVKGRQYRQPLYGRQDVARFLYLVRRARRV